MLCELQLACSWWKFSLKDLKHKKRFSVNRAAKKDWKKGVSRKHVICSSLDPSPSQNISLPSGYVMRSFTPWTKQPNVSDQNVSVRDLGTLSPQPRSLFPCSQSPTPAYSTPVTQAIPMLKIPRLFYLQDVVAVNTESVWSFICFCRLLICDLENPTNLKVRSEQ